MTEDAKASCLESPNNLKHDKYTFKRLTSTMFNGKLYYSIVYEKDGEEHEGYSSFSLDVISDFLKEYFLPEPKQTDSGDDLIRRRDAIDAMCSVCGNDCDKSKFVYDAPQWEQVILCPEHYALSVLPSVQPEPQWTPCSKRLPDENGFYLVTDDSGGPKETHESFFVKRDGDSVYWNFTNVIAWKKMPDPYGGEQ